MFSRAFKHETVDVLVRGRFGTRSGQTRVESGLKRLVAYFSPPPAPLPPPHAHMKGSGLLGGLQSGTHSFFLGTLPFSVGTMLSTVQGGSSGSHSTSTIQ